MWAWKMSARKLWARKLWASMSIAALVLAVGGSAAAADRSPVLDRVKRNGWVSCGVDQTPGFAGFDPQGRPVGFDVDFCRAVAAAVLGDSDAIRVRRIGTQAKFDALARGDIDVAFGMTTWTHARDTAMGASFPAVIYHDGQGFLAWSEGGPKSLDELEGRRICVQQGTTSAANLTDFIVGRGFKVEVVAVSSSEEKMSAFAQKLCTVVTGDSSELAARMGESAARPGQWRLIPGTISREPLGPVVAKGDERWFSIVRWAVLVPQIAEARGVTSANVAEFRASGDGELRRLAGGEAGFGKAVGLDQDWAARIVAGVGNYSEIFQRNLGRRGIERGLNRLWNEGGLLYPPPLR